MNKRTYKKLNMYKVVGLLFVIISVLSAQLVRAEDEQIARFDNWAVLKGQEESQKYCYAVTVPFETKAYYSDSERFPYLLVVYVNPERFTIGVDNGYVIDKKKGVLVTVAHRARTLNIVNVYRNARTYSDIEDAAIINDIIQSDNMLKVESFGIEGRRAIDYYSLKPVRQVLNYMINNCY